MEKEIQKAEPEQRRKAQRILLAGTMLGMLILILAVPPLKHYLTTLKCGEAAPILMALLVFVFLVPCVAGIFMIRVAGRILRDERFPYEGAKVIRDTVVYRGKQAKAIGTFLMFLAVLVILLCISGIIYSIVLLARFV
jgi:hypothetical protein